MDNQTPAQVTSDLITVTVPRSEWLRGEGPGKSYLLRPEDGKRCCIGHVLKALGVPDEAMLGRKVVHAVLTGADLSPKCPASFTVDGGTSYSLTCAYEENDRQFINPNPFGGAERQPEPERERVLTEIGKDLGIAFTFID